MDPLFAFIESLSNMNRDNFYNYIAIGMELIKNIEIYNAKKSIGKSHCFILIDNVYLYCGTYISILIKNKLISICAPTSYEFHMLCEMVDEVSYRDDGSLKRFEIYDSHYKTSMQDSIRWLLDHRSTKSANN